jgi:hypothetical protein
LKFTRVQQKLEIPRAGVGLHQVDGGAIAAQTDACEIQVPPQQAQPAHAGVQRFHIGERLDTGARILVDGDVFQSEARSTQKIQVHRPDFHLASKPTTQRTLDRRAQQI